ncbi:MarR family winged helix-turn-helix transcriptional regulator [Actinacidiphila alni]|uniref:MarR family winged helix-turn-helix transcriptional regulator n=1 Tax=Actinacidiphila alni TaxID=380248 RepID=UPI003454EFBF
MPNSHPPQHPMSPPGGRAPARIEDRATWLLSRAFARSSGLLAAAFESSGRGLRGYHYRLLAALDESGPASQADLGRATGIDRSDVTAALSDLESHGLVERSVDPDHRRRKIVTITAPGTARLTELDAVVDAVQDRLLAPLTAAQRRQFLALLAKLLPADDAPPS